MALKSVNRLSEWSQWAGIVVSGVLMWLRVLLLEVVEKSLRCGSTSKCPTVDGTYRTGVLMEFCGPLSTRKVVGPRRDLSRIAFFRLLCLLLLCCFGPRFSYQHQHSTPTTLTTLTTLPSPHLLLRDKFESVTQRQQPQCRRRPKDQQGAVRRPGGQLDPPSKRAAPPRLAPPMPLPGLPARRGRRSWPPVRCSISPRPLPRAPTGLPLPFAR